MKWAGIAYPWSSLCFPLLSRRKRSEAEIAKLKPRGFKIQPIEFTVVYPAGGGVDVSARLLAKQVESSSGDRIIVNNRTGGAGMVGHSSLATQAKPDGYTVGVMQAFCGATPCCARKVAGRTPIWNRSPM